MTHRSKCLVIDTDIASSAGGENAQATRSKQCRDVLKTMLNSGHAVVVTEMISEEWRRHQSSFTRTWLRTMYGKRKVCKLDISANEELRGKIKQVTVEEKKRNAMLKDVHLVEAALEADKTVISMDETVRSYFDEIAPRVVIFKQIAWVNPVKDDEECLEWLYNGAEEERKRMLGYRPDANT